MWALFQHQLKEKVRSTIWQKNLILNIVLGLLGLYLLANIIVIGFFSDKIIISITKENDAVSQFTGYLFFYFSFDLILRFLLQPLTVLSINHYLTLPIKKSRLIHYIILKSSTNFFNVVAFLFFTTFSLKNIFAVESIQFGLAWIISVFSLVATNNFLNYLLKKYFNKKPLLILLLVLVLVLIIYLNFKGTLAITTYFSTALLYIANHPIWVILPILIAVLSYFVVFKTLQHHAYIEDKRSDVASNGSSFSFFDQYGEIGRLISMELKMIFRNKRPKSLIYISCFFLLYGFMFYRPGGLPDNIAMQFLPGFLLSSVFALNYGQFLFSWESSFFDFILTNRISAFNYIRSKHLFLTITCIASFIITLPYAFFNIEIAFVNTAFLLYNIGVSVIFLMYFSTFNSSYIDLGKSQFMNYQGVSGTHFLLIIPIMGIPGLIYFAFYLFNITSYYFYAIALIGILGIIFNNYILELITKKFCNRKYKMAAGFRSK